MNKKLTLLLSICSFFLAIYFITPLLIDKKSQTLKKGKEGSEFKNRINNAINDLANQNDKFQLDFLNKDNLYENYSHNYTIKIPEGYTKNDGIGKFSSVQFYNENLGYVAAVNVGSTNLESVNRATNAKIIKEYKNEFDKNNSNLENDFKNSLIERGFNKVTLDNYKIVDYNNRLFIRLNFSAFRTSDNQQKQKSIVNFVTFNKKLIYSFMFVSNQWNSLEKWEYEIQKSMSNVIISKYITKKD